MQKWKKYIYAILVYANFLTYVPETFGMYPSRLERVWRYINNTAEVLHILEYNSVSILLFSVSVYLGLQNADSYCFPRILAIAFVSDTTSLWWTSGPTETLISDLDRACEKKHFRSTSIFSTALFSSAYASDSCEHFICNSMSFNILKILFFFALE